MSHFGLFEAYGIELEYMIVDRDSLAIAPIADRLLAAAAGQLVSDFEDGLITWSNELVLHVIELKTTHPVNSLENLEYEFHRSLNKANSLLGKFNCRLMPTAMHPLMRAHEEMKLWPHDNSEIYAAYDRIFGCKGHGWSNLQSLHINLPFKDDQEFERLHTAIRFLLPIMPALTASSPIVEGELTGVLDRRLEFYQNNQRRIPMIAGQVIPEYASSIQDYKQSILEKIYKDIAPHDPQRLLQDDWLNSRGAIPRFGRQSIEIRVLDIQETPVADLAIAKLICATLQELVEGRLVPLQTQRSFATSTLKDIFDITSTHGESEPIQNPAYATAWGATDKATASEIWKKIFADVHLRAHIPSSHAATIEDLLALGPLAKRISRALGPSPSREDIVHLYRHLCDCLDQHRLFSA